MIDMKPELIDNFTHITFAAESIEEIIETLPQPERERISNELFLITLTLEELLLRVGEYNSNQDGWQAFMLIVKQLRFMTDDILDECQGMG